ncbi:MAG TPA: aspartate aminotransferase family protein [Solirubrobacteraceae bacterium]|nr:aspartate aminotransferase family protein [Solirubrobacteraceae bacterium]
MLSEPSILAPGVTDAEAPADVFRRARRRLAPGIVLAQKLTGRGALEVAAEGAEVELSDGRVVLDFGSYGVTLLGHRCPAVLAAVERQLGRLPTSTRALANEITPLLAERLVELTDPRRFSRVYLGQDGADAVEAALKLARLASGRPRVLALEGAYHGKTLGALAATAHPGFRAGLDGLLGGVTHIRWEPDAVAAQVRHGDVAALLFEPIQGEGGLRALPSALLERWAHDARAADVFVISDEVQVGLRRCGPVSVALAMGLEPDAVLFGKHLGGGVLPLSAAVCTEELYRPLLRDPFTHTATFAGHPLCCAAGVAALEELERHASAGTALAVALERHLDALARTWPEVVAQVRTHGLAAALECRTRALTGELLAELGPNGLLVSPCLSSPETIRLLPPIVTDDTQLERAMGVISGACATVSTTSAEGAKRP